MSALPEFIRFLEHRFQSELLHMTDLPPSPGERSPLPPELDSGLAEALRADGIEGLWSHQREAYASIREGKDTLLVSKTASGKTLAFLLPILDAYRKAKTPFSTLFLYPTKALSRDQEASIGRYLGAGAAAALGTYDGDSPRDERTRILASADFVISNPDMLHAAVLPNHQRNWKRILARLRYIVIDEVHIYRGAFGSHVANVLRRLQRVCALHGSNPTFVCSSATIGNPAELAGLLCGKTFSVVDNDGAPRPRRSLYFLNPPLKEGPGLVPFRKGPAAIAIPLLREAAKLNLRTIAFCRARQEVERLCKAVVDGRPELRSKVKPYRGGLLPSERRQLERDLFGGSITAIVSTSALELGINIGDLEVCLLCGHPGSIASFWQQAGRVGRSGKQAVIIYIAKDAPVDQFLVRHPEFATSAPIERAWLDADNPYVLLQHLPCAAYEHPLREQEKGYAAELFGDAAEILQKDGVLKPWHDLLRYTGEDYPGRGVNLRGMTDYNVEIHCGTEVIGELDPIGARGTLYKDAIYQHLGRKYLSLDLDLAKKLCSVAEVEVDYFTEAVWDNRLTCLSTEAQRELHGHKLTLHQLRVHQQPKLYKKIRERSYENIGYGPITLEPFAYETVGFALLPAKAWCEAVGAIDKRYPDLAMRGLAYLLERIAPILCMGDKADLRTDVALEAEQSAQLFPPALYLYDALEGGIGYAEKIYEIIEETLTLCRTVLLECPCTAGCPSCIPPVPPGVTEADLETLLLESDAAHVCVASLLTSLLDGQMVLPEVSLSRAEGGLPPEDPGRDLEREQQREKLSRAAELLKRRRERTH